MPHVLEIIKQSKVLVLAQELARKEVLRFELSPLKAFVLKVDISLDSFAVRLIAKRSIFWQNWDIDLYACILFFCSNKAISYIPGVTTDNPTIHISTGTHVLPAAGGDIMTVLQMVWIAAKCAPWPWFETWTLWAGNQAAMTWEASRPELLLHYYSRCVAVTIFNLLTSIAVNGDQVCRNNAYIIREPVSGYLW